MVPRGALVTEDASRVDTFVAWQASLGGEGTRCVHGVFSFLRSHVV
jgi:hypothetical protein